MYNKQHSIRKVWYIKEIPVGIDWNDTQNDGEYQYSNGEILAVLPYGENVQVMEICITCLFCRQFCFILISFSR